MKRLTKIARDMKRLPDAGIKDFGELYVWFFDRDMNPLSDHDMYESVGEISSATWIYDTFEGVTYYIDVDYVLDEMGRRLIDNIFVRDSLGNKRHNETSTSIYEIVKAYEIYEGKEVVIGRNSNQWACWYCDNGNDYHTGSYSTSYKDIQNEFLDRIR